MESRRPESVQNYLDQHKNLNTFLALINARRVLMTMAVIQVTNNNLYFSIDRIAQEILYFDHDENARLRQHRLENGEILRYLNAQSTREYYKLIYDKDCSIFPQEVILMDVYDGIQQSFMGVKFTDLCVMIEKKVFSKINEVMVNSEVKDCLERRTNWSEKEYRLIPQVLSSLSNPKVMASLSLGYFNSKIFTGQHIIDIKPENRLVADGYMFDAEELLQFPTDYFYTNPYTKKEYSLEGKMTIDSHPKLAARKSLIEKAWRDSQKDFSSLSQPMKQCLAVLVLNLNQAAPKSSAENQAILAFNAYYESLSSDEKITLDNITLSMRVNGQTLRLKFNNFYSQFMLGDVDKIGARKVLSRWIAKLYTEPYQYGNHVSYSQQTHITLFSQPLSPFTHPNGVITQPSVYHGRLSK